MISEKDYLKLMKQQPYMDCPNEITKIIVRKSGILEQSAYRRSSFSEKYYGFACALLTLLILGLGLLGPIEPANNIKIALNTKVLVSQFTHGAMVLLTGQNR